MRFVRILFSLTSVSVFAAELDSIRSEQRPEGLFVIHEVEEAETVYSIAGRYKSSVQSIVEFNKILNDRIEIGQVLSVLVKRGKEKGTQVTVSENRNTHIVSAGETLYSISKKYDIRLRELRELNGLESSSISLGQVLRLNRRALIIEDESPEVTIDSNALEVTENHGFSIAGFESYLVQAGETLISIAKKVGVRVEEIKERNNLSSNYLKVGQELLLRRVNLEDESMNDTVKSNTKMDADGLERVYEEGTASVIADISVARDENMTDTVKSNTKMNEDGFERVYEEGIASVIEDISTARYLALHRFLPIGTELAVRNLINNLVVHVKVVGRLPDTGINKDVLLRLSGPAYDQLRILDAKSRVEVSHFKK